MPQFSIQITADAVAWYGAIVATLGIIVSALNLGHQYWRERVNIKVAVTVGWIGYGADMSTTKIMITASNKGRRPVTLNTAGLELDDGSNMFFPNTTMGGSLPFELQEGKALVCYADKEKVGKQLMESGRHIKSAWFTTMTAGTFKTYKNLPTFS